MIESLSLVSLTVRLGEELGVDIVELGLELGDVKNVGDLVNLARVIERHATQPEKGAHP